MSVFTKEAFQMSSMPPSASTSRKPTPAPSRSRSPEPQEEAVDEHIVEIEVEAVLFDMDGTLINSAPAVVTAWELFAKTYPLDLDDILRSAHGMRTIDVLRKWCKIQDPELLASEVIRFETTILESARALAEAGGAGIETLPGVAKLLNDLSSEKQHESRGGKEMWAVCTSSTFYYASQALPTAGLETPNVFVTADVVTRGKPHPEPYIKGAQGCGASIFDCLVVEDAPTGLRSGKASGAMTLATCTSHTQEELEKERPDFLVKDLSHVTAKWDASIGRFKLIIEQPLGRTTPAATPDSTPLVTPAVSRGASFSSIGGSSRPDFWRGSDELSGNDSVIGTPATSRPGSPELTSDGGLARRASWKQGVPGGVSLEGFRRALAGNAQKPTNRRPSLTGLGEDPESEVIKAEVRGGEV